MKMSLRKPYTDFKITRDLTLMLHTVRAYQDNQSIYLLDHWMPFVNVSVGNRFGFCNRSPVRTYQLVIRIQPVHGRPTNGSGSKNVSSLPSNLSESHVTVTYLCEFHAIKSVTRSPRIDSADLAITTSDV